MRKILHEEDSHFVADDGQGPFKISKALLRHSTVERMRKYAEGGKVIPEGTLDEEGEGGLPWEGHDPFPAQQPYGGQSQEERFKAEDARNAAANRPALDDAAARQPASQGAPEMLAAPAPEAAPPPAASGQPGTLGIQDPDPQAAINAGVQQERRAIAGESQARAAQAQAVGAAESQSANDQQAMAAQHQAVMAQEQQRADAMFRGVMDAKINPDHFWETRGTGQKITGAIGLILGGIGAGINGGPNPAIGIIDKAIDRDMDAQRLNLGKSQALLSQQMARMGHMETSHQLAKADYLTMTAARIQAAAAKSGSAIAMAEGQKAAGALAIQATQLRQQGAMGAISLQQAQTQLAVQQQHMQALGKLLSGISGGGGFDRRILEMPGMESYRERAVDLPDGSVALAGDKQEAQKAIDSMQTVSRLKSKLQRYTEMLNSGSPETIDSGKAQGERADLLAEMGHLHDLNRLSDRDLQLFEQQVPDISRWFSLKALDRRRLGEVGKSIDDKIWSMNKTLLHRPDTARP